MTATKITAFPASAVPPPDNYVFVLADPAGVHLAANYKIRYGDLKLAFGGTSGVIPGMDGTDGDEGMMGPPGINGVIGVNGINGAVGPMGVSGEDGVDGNDGRPGVAGTNGTNGANGANGFAGFDGVDGEDGIIGPPGLQGIQGIQGLTGSVGPAGAVYLPEENTTEESSYIPPDTLYNGVTQSTPLVADQSPTAATLTIITGSKISAPLDAFVIGQKFKWTIYGTKTAVGTAATTFNIKIGTAGTTADGNVATFTTGLGTAAVDTFTVVIEMTIRTLGAAATASGHCMITHNGNAAGFIVIPTAVIAGTMATFNSTVRALFATIAVTSGATVALTIQQCFAEIFTPTL